MTSSSAKPLTLLEEKVLAFVREHGAEPHGALVPRGEANCNDTFGADPAHVQAALFTLQERGLVTLHKALEHCIPVTPVLSAKERAARHRAKQAALGRKQMVLWVTPEEEAALKEALDGMRRAKVL